MSKSSSGYFSGTKGSSAIVWNDITPTQPNYPGTALPRSFVIKTDGETLWVHGNATEHMAEYLIKQTNTGNTQGNTKLATQIMLYDMQQSLGSVTKNGISYRRILHHGNWDFIIHKARDDESYDAVVHAFMKKIGGLIMKYYNKSVRRVIQYVDYIPVQLRTEKECQATAYYIIRNGDCSLLELALYDKNATICRITLLICEKYQRKSELYHIPNEHRRGDLLVETPGETDSQVFRCEIYQNAVKIIVSSENPSDCISSENVVWEISDKGDLVSLCILDSTGELSEHCFKELEANKK